MQRPENPQLDAIFATVERIREAEASLRALKARVAAEAHTLAEISDKRARVEAALYAYWYAPEVNASDISFGATGRSLRRGPADHQPRADEGDVGSASVRHAPVGGGLLRALLGVRG